jgi:hypothetical protein
MRTTSCARALVAGAALFATLSLTPAPANSQSAGTTYLDNGRIRVGVDLDNGGKISFLAPASGPGSGTNLVFQSVQSYYRNRPGEPAFWHAANDSPDVLASSNNGRTVYTKAVPQSTWPSFGPCECTLEQWVSLDGTAIRVRNRLTNFLADAARYPASAQELPALYTFGATRRIVTYDRGSPYTNGPLRELTQADGGQLFVETGPAFRATEHWAALVDDDGFGVGLFEPERTLFTGVAGAPGVNPYALNGYLTAPTPEVLDANITYSYSYTLIVGTIDSIRSYAYAHRPDSRPNYRFRGDRQSWTLWNATDRGFPITGALRVSVAEDDPQLIGPAAWWRAKRVPRIYVRGRWHTTQNVAEVFWRHPLLGESGERRRAFRVVNDGLFHTYRVDLFRTPTYRGGIGGLRLDPVFSAEPNGLVDITCISWRPCPVDRKAEAPLLGGDDVPLLDDFSNSLDGSFWWVGRNGTGPTVDVNAGRLELGMPTGSAPDLGQTWISADVQSRCSIRGDFDVQVDVNLLEWPSANGVHVALAVADNRAVVRSNTGRDEVVAWFPPWASSMASDRLSESYRLRRRGTWIYGYVLGRGGWFELARGRFFEADAFARLQVGASSTDLSGEPVRVAFDNFRISSGRLVCP